MWAYVVLSKEEVLRVRLPAHKEANLPEGPVATAVTHFQNCPQDFQCRERMVRPVDDSCPVFLKRILETGLGAFRRSSSIDRVGHVN